ncbi:MAG: hypothetical protein ACOWWM_19430 [Desulfobacterales bacterium]
MEYLGFAAVPNVEKEDGLFIGKRCFQWNASLEQVIFSIEKGQYILEATTDGF